VIAPVHNLKYLWQGIFLEISVSIYVLVSSIGFVAVILK